MKKIKNRKKFLFGITLLLIIFVIFIIILLRTFIYYNENKISQIYIDSDNKAQKNKIVDINKYESKTNVDENLQNQYFNEVMEILQIKNFDGLYSKTNSAFLEKNGLDENNFEGYILKNEYVGSFPSCTSMKVSIQKDGSYIYRMKCFRDNRAKFYVNLIGNRPFEYTLDFSQDEIPTTDDISHTFFYDEYNLEFNVEEIKRTEEYISYKLKISNSGEKEIEFYLNNITDMALILDNEDSKVNGYVKQATSVLSSRKYVIKKDSYFIKEMYFPLDMQYHSKVKGMIFYNVRINDTNQDIEIAF